MQTIADETRARVAAGWEKSGLSQAEYAARNAISERTLRAWRVRFAPSGMPADQAREIICDAIERPQALLAVLDERPASALTAPSAEPAAARIEADAAAAQPYERELPAPAEPAGQESPPPDAGRQAIATSAPPAVPGQRRVRRGTFFRDFM